MTKAVKPGTALVVKRHVIRDRTVIAQAAEFAEAQVEMKRLKERVDALKPLLLGAMGEHDVVTAGNRTLTRGEVAAIAATDDVTITKTMVGSIIPGRAGRAGYKTLTVR